MATTFARFTLNPIENLWGRKRMLSEQRPELHDLAGNAKTRAWLIEWAQEGWMQIFLEEISDYGDSCVNGVEISANHIIFLVA
ncbi:hypothetical protein N7539_000052 [Penicillium diatomitis]|uniref:Uncharacterized protein n=1 Tax=Penicillium diatomitis TaxID=2819901 RepID=A0A9X0C1Z0_9EURO|nr:uncharacterized protein N7539_000052 [Penicillium diatomitis]KAJ5494936.1 hypothetical protein N7539_000052 [Penicillium diatomitis]